MADGHLCIHCSRQETTHQYPEYDSNPSEVCKGDKYSLATCPGYDDGIKHLPNCPGRRKCAGNCEETIRQLNWAATIQEHRAKNIAVFYRRSPNGPMELGIIDIGS